MKRDNKRAIKSEISHAVEILKNGGIVAIPTETVYGLAAAIDNPKAVESIFKTKQRPFFDPLIVHVSSVEQARALTTKWSGICDILASKFWPGPLTLVLPKSGVVSDVITSGLTTVGIRMPNHQKTLELIEKLGVPVAAPSANKFGRTSPTSAEHVKAEFPEVNLFVVDGGNSNVGIESTILSVEVIETGENSKQNSKYILSILRKGMITQERISNLLNCAGINFEFNDDNDGSRNASQELTKNSISAPGQMKHHYMPNVPLVIVESKSILTELSSDRSSAINKILKIVNEQIKTLPDQVEGVKINKPTKAISDYEILELGDDAAIAARNLYGKLRDLSGKDMIIYFAFKSNIESFKANSDFSLRQSKIIHSKSVETEWDSINERLYKAASLIIK